MGLTCQDRTKKGLTFVTALLKCNLNKAHFWLEVRCNSFICFKLDLDLFFGLKIDFKLFLVLKQNPVEFRQDSLHQNKTFSFCSVSKELQNDKFKIITTFYPDKKSFICSFLRIFSVKSENESISSSREDLDHIIVDILERYSFFLHFLAFS